MSEQRRPEQSLADFLGVLIRADDILVVVDGLRFTFDPKQFVPLHEWVLNVSGSQDVAERET